MQQLRFILRNGFKPLRRIKRNCCILLDLFHYYKAWCTEPQILNSSKTNRRNLLTSTRNKAIAKNKTQLLHVVGLISLLVIHFSHKSVPGDSYFHIEVNLHLLYGTFSFENFVREPYLECQCARCKRQSRLKHVRVFIVFGKAVQMKSPIRNPSVVTRIVEQFPLECQQFSHFHETYPQLAEDETIYLFWSQRAQLVQQLGYGLDYRGFGFRCSAVA